MASRIMNTLRGSGVQGPTSVATDIIAQQASFESRLLQALGQAATLLSKVRDVLDRSNPGQLSSKIKGFSPDTLKQSIDHAINAIKNYEKVMLARVQDEKVAQPTLRMSDAKRWSASKPQMKRKALDHQAIGDCLDAAYEGMKERPQRKQPRQGKDPMIEQNSLDGLREKMEEFKANVYEQLSQKTAKAHEVGAEKSAAVKPTAFQVKIADANGDMDMQKTPEQLLMEESSSTMEVAANGDWRRKLLDDFKEATPVTDAWFEENNYEVLSNEGTGNNCLILALLQHATGINNDSKRLASLASKVRKNFDEIDPEHQGGKMLEIEMHTDEGRERLQTLVTLVKQELESTGLKGNNNLHSTAVILNPIIVVPSENRIPAVGGGDEKDLSDLEQHQMIIYGRNGSYHFEAVKKKEENGSSGISDKR